MSTTDHNRAPDHRAEAERMIAARPAVAEVHALLSIDARLARLDDTLRTILCWEEPPEEVLERVKAETLEKAAQDGENAPLAGAGHDQASYTGSVAADASEAAQTLADLTPCLGDRVRVASSTGREMEMTYAWGKNGRFGWLYDSVKGSEARDPGVFWTVLEHLDPVTPEEPPVGAGMLVDVDGDLWRRDESGWQPRVSLIKAWGSPGHEWERVCNYGPLRPATPADLAEHGVDEQGEPVGKGGQVAITMRPAWSHSTAEHWRTEASILRDLRPETTAAAALCDALADALDGAR